MEVKDPIILLAVLIVVGYFCFLTIPSLLSVDFKSDPKFLEALVNTSIYASIAVVVVLPLAAVIGYASMKRIGRRILPLMLFTTAIPHTAIGVLISPVFFATLLYDTPIAVIVSMIVVALPLAVTVILGSLTAIGTDLEDFLRSMGLPSWRILIFYLRSIPSGLVLAMLISWFRAYSELGAFLIVSQRPLTIGIHIYEAFLKEGLEQVAGLSLLLVAISIAAAYLLILMGYATGKRP